MRIAMVHSSFAVRGGAERYVRDLTTGLLDRGHEVRVFSRPSEHEEAADQSVGRRVSERLGDRTGPLRKVFTHLGDVADPTGLSMHDVAAFAPDVVHVHNWQGLGIRPVRKLAETWPTCHSVHDFAVADPNNALGNLGKAKALDAVLAARSAMLVRNLRDVTLLFPSERTRQTLLRHVPAAAELAQRVVLLSTPVPPARRALPPGDQRTFLFLGALSPHKGLADLLAAWTANPLGTLLVGGDGPMRDEVAALAGREPSVEFLGYLGEDGKRAALLRAGWFVFASQWPETYGLVCAEALIAGRPILASRIAEPVMASPGSYLLFDEPADLPARLAEAATMPAAVYRGMTASALADGARLDWDTHVDAIVDSYETVRSRRRLPADRG
ncbi:glycosyltransferase [Paractinoplanes durhamensis]|uniref:Glycosyl transferase n=1 Tax=Paractinoplanes durhamensis TaxID=113563 RepID=A0ABQ3Z3A9_9ACTN|nr:glycosyltransferase [Actinoplanes durhamensis]GIE04318.1 glycosyl transferase [Actinoplanes durhamensis]